MKIQLSIDIPDYRINELCNNSHINSTPDKVKIALDYTINTLIDEVQSNIIDECIYGRLAHHFINKLDELDKGVTNATR